MAKATAPLFAIEASGKLGDTVVYDKRGFVRIYTKPANPQTDDQKQIRCQFKAMAEMVKKTGAQARADAKTKAQVSYRWSSEIIGLALKNNNWNLWKSQYAAMDSTTRSDWENYGQDFIVPATGEPCLDYTNGASGQIFYTYTRALKELGLMPPTGSDSPDDWDTYLKAS